MGARSEVSMKGNETTGGRESASMGEATPSPPTGIDQGPETDENPSSDSHFFSQLRRATDSLHHQLKVTTIANAKTSRATKQPAEEEDDREYEKFLEENVDNAMYVFKKTVERAVHQYVNTLREDGVLSPSIETKHGFCVTIAREEGNKLRKEAEENHNPSEDIPLPSVEDAQSRRFATSSEPANFSPEPVTSSSDPTPSSPEPAPLPPEPVGSS
ncbi:hypothetical protein MMC14_000637 [Varicellaria rhodocarpa]|nr:hypothetical protein [Varicellaria rhodocarpa]